MMPGGDEHGVPPLVHVPVVVVDDVRVLEAAPAAEQGAAAAHLVVAGQRLVEEVEDVVVERHRALDEVQAPGQAHQVVGEDLRGGDGADAARVEGRGVDVAAFHQAAHLPGQAAHLERFLVHLALEGVEGAHDVGDRLEAVRAASRGGGALGPFEDRGVGLLDHAFAEVDEDQVVLEDRVVEHELRGLAEVDDPVGERGAA
ncbi:hypothetical protein GCM10020000_01180 [Streptomyces olivoverticillatus]